MKRYLILSAMMLFAFTGRMQAQNGLDHDIKESIVRLSIGSGFYSGGFPVYAYADFLVHPNWTVGPQVDFVFNNHFHFVLSGRADYHFNKLLNIPSDTWDVYAGATMGVDFSHHTTFSSGIHAGGRWYWNKTWGLNAEIGGGTYFAAKLGVSFRL